MKIFDMNQSTLSNTYAYAGHNDIHAYSILKKDEVGTFVKTSYKKQSNLANLWLPASVL